MKLDVPIVKQKYKLGCGVAATFMVYKYFNQEISEKDIKDKVGGLTKWGSFTTDHALIARDLGFKITCRSYNLEYFTPEDLKLPRRKLIRKTKRLIKKEKRKYNKRELQSILRILEDGVDFKMEIPSLGVIKEFLDKKLPVITSVNAAVLFEEEKELDMGHFIVLTGYRGDKFYYNDPARGKKNSISADRLIFALSNNVFDSSAYLLVIEPKE